MTNYLFAKGYPPSHPVGSLVVLTEDGRKKWNEDRYGVYLVESIFSSNNRESEYSLRKVNKNREPIKGHAFAWVSAKHVHRLDQDLAMLLGMI